MAECYCLLSILRSKYLWSSNFLSKAFEIDKFYKSVSITYLDHICLSKNLQNLLYYNTRFLLPGVTICSLQVVKYLFETLSFIAKFGMYQLKLKLVEPRCIKLSSDIIKISWCRKQILNFSIEPKNQCKYFFISALASESGLNQENIR